MARKTFFWLAAGGILLRLVYLTEHAGSAFFDVPILDEKYYDAVARALVEGRSIAEINPGFRPLLYPFFLAFFYQLAGEWGRIAALVAQHLLGVGTALLVALLALRVYGRVAAAALAGTLYLLAAPPLFFEGELLITTLFTFLAALQLVLVSRLERPAEWLGAGAFTAFAAQARPSVLPFLAAYPLAGMLDPHPNPLPGGEGARISDPSGSPSPPGRGGWGVRVKRGALALAGALVMLVLWGLVDAHFTGHFQLLGGAGGVNLYLGNKRGADGMIPRQDRTVTYGAEYRDSVQVFAFEVYREQLEHAGEIPAERLDPGAVSRYWTKRTLAEIRAAPAAWAGLMLRKLGYLAGAREVPNNKNLAFVKEHESAVLRYLPVHWWMLFALAPLGAAWGWRRGERGERRLLLWIGLFVVLYAAGIWLFFVNSRYRLPLWPALAVLAAGGLSSLADALGQRRWRQLAGKAALVALLAALSLGLGRATPMPDWGRDFFFRSLAHLEKGRLEEAAADARRAVALDPDEAVAHFQLATVDLAAGRTDAAVDGFERAAALSPGEARTWNNLGVARERRGEIGAAHRAYCRALALAGDYPPALINAALLELRAGLVEKASEKLARAAESGFESVSYHAARAFVATAEGRPAEAERALEAARQLDPEATARLVAEQHQRLAPEVLLLEDDK